MFGGKSDVKFSGAYQQQEGYMFHKLLEFCAHPFGKTFDMYRCNRYVLLLNNTIGTISRKTI